MILEYAGKKKRFVEWNYLLRRLVYVLQAWFEKEIQRWSVFFGTTRLPALLKALETDYKR
jgi:hypothetical protein